MDIKMYSLKIKLKNFTSRIDTEEHIQEVNYKYSIEDSIGLLEIELTIPEEADPVEYFVLHTKDLYKYNIPIDYVVYHGKYRYWLIHTDDGYEFQKIKMY